jgi:predicted ATP-grasp superfamily ATP-dependent carboligase
MSPSVLLTDAHARSTVGTIDSLVGAGYVVGAATSDPPAPGQSSRRRQGPRYRLSDPRADPRQFAQQVAQIASDGSFATVLPGSDASVLALSNHRELFGGGVNLGLPRREVVDRCVSKVAMLRDAAEVGLASPESIACSTPDEARSAASELGYPVLLKPRQTVFDDGGVLKQRQTLIVEDEGDLIAALPDFGLPCLLQRFEQGGVVSIAGVAAGERLLAVVFSRYLRTWPVDAGPVSFSRTEAPPPGLVERVAALCQATGWQGIFELELVERADGGHAAIDFNPRLYGSIALAAKAGAPIPAVWCKWLLDGAAEERVAAAGVSYRWEEAEVRNTLAALQAGRTRDALRIIRPREPVARAYWRWSDPGPAATMALRMVKSRLKDRSAAKAAKRPGR